MFETYYKPLYEHIMGILIEAKGSHDKDHTIRVINMAEHIAKAEKADREIILCAALLHDIGREEESRSKGIIKHAELGSKKAKSILSAYPFSSKFIEHVSECIRTHSYKNQDPPATIEAKVLFDADKLDALGAIGIGRCYVFAGEIGARVHNNDVDIEKTQSYTREDTAYREYMVKLRFLKDKMFTAEGKRIAQERSLFMDEFFERINMEVEGIL